MGILNWAMKGVNVESRKTQNNKGGASVAPGQVVETPMQNAIPNLNDFSAPIAGEPQASSILFSHTEPVQNAYQMYGNNLANALGGATLGNRNILIITPKTNADVSGVVQNLQNGDACIVCFEEMSAQDAQRRLDFLSGVICAIGGSIKALNSYTYILTPSGIGVRN